MTLCDEHTIDSQTRKISNTIAGVCRNCHHIFSREHSMVRAIPSPALPGCHGPLPVFDWLRFVFSNPQTEYWSIFRSSTLYRRPRDGRKVHGTVTFPNLASALAKKLRRFTASRLTHWIARSLRVDRTLRNQWYGADCTMPDWSCDQSQPPFNCDSSSSSIAFAEESSSKWLSSCLSYNAMLRQYGL
jgi:hypothetical protein